MNFPIRQSTALGRRLVTSAICVLSAASLYSAEPPIEMLTELRERTEDTTVFRRIIRSQNREGRVVSRTNEFTLFENAVNYRENGQWKPSEDLIENFPDGAVARRGPNKGIFAHDLNAPAVFDIVAPNGLRLEAGCGRSRPRIWRRAGALFWES